MNELPITEIGAGGILAYLLLKECLKGVRLILERRNGRRNGPACRQAGTEERPPVCDSEVKSALQENGKALASIGERLSHVHEQLGEINSHIAGIWKRPRLPTGGAETFRLIVRLDDDGALSGADDFEVVGPGAVHHAGAG